MYNYYRRFIPGFSIVARPLNMLTKKRMAFMWSKDCDDAFNKLKSRLCKPHILKYPNFDEQFIITTDASQYGVGAVLSQLHNGVDSPIAFASRAFLKSEINKSTIEKEMLAIHFAIKHFRPYVYGVKFLVRSDHRPLQFLYSMKDPSSKLSRMRLDLAEYDFTIEYIKGADNVVADSLSRIDFADIKSIPENNANILAITRSMSKPDASYP